jgi:hypothetical protein
VNIYSLFCEAFWDVSSSLSRLPNAIKKCDLSGAESLSIGRPSADINTEHDMKIEATVLSCRHFRTVVMVFMVFTAAMFI